MPLLFAYCLARALPPIDELSTTVLLFVDFQSVPLRTLDVQLPYPSCVLCVVSVISNTATTGNINMLSMLAVLAPI